MEIFTLLIESFIQLLVFSAIPFLWWLVAGRKTGEGFLRYIGILWPQIDPGNGRRAVKLTGLFVLLTAALLPLMGPALSSSATTAYSQDGFSLRAMGNILIFSFVQTGLAEEVLFRGFLAKRLNKQFGFGVGCAVQCSLFGLMHAPVFFMGVGVWTGVAVVVYAAVTAFLQTYLNEKVCGGSILPGYLIHGLTNVLSGISGFFL